MKAEMKTARPRSRWSLSALEKLTLLALLGCTVGYAWLDIQAGGFVLPLVILTVVMLLGAGVVAIGRRWTPLAGVVLGIGTLIGGSLQPYFVYHITHPNELIAFVPSILIIVCDIIALGGGLMATLQNYRSAERRAPRWVAPALTALAGLMLGAIIVAAIPPANAAPVSAAGEPTVHAGAATFAPNAIRVPQGQKLKIVDDSSIEHILDNGRWKNATPDPEQEPGAPQVHNLMLNGNTVEIGPFTTPGTYYIFCTIHVGMDLIILVS
jgi:plastocyanin